MPEGVNAGADYMYRVNDDTEMIGIGPISSCKRFVSDGNPRWWTFVPRKQKILTSDLLRDNNEIFEMNYYPPELTDWWMDDLISFVYGKTRFQSKTVKVIHHTGAHGQR